MKRTQPEMPERKHAGDPNAVLARPLALPSDPVATGRPRHDDWCSLVTPAFGYWLVKPSLGMLLGGRAKDFHNGHYAKPIPILTQLSRYGPETC